MTWWPAIVGVLLLFLGRRLYWLFVGGIGFVVGYALASGLTGRTPEPTALLIGLGAGLLGVVLALFLQRVAVVVAGLLAGAWLGAELARALGSPSPGTPWLAVLIGGVAGAVLSAALFDAVLVVLSSLVGAAFLAKLFGGRLWTQGVVFIGLTLLGIAVQARTKHRRAFRDDRRPAVRP
jgi:hypothetical protein